MEGITNTAVFCYTSSSLLRKECEMKTTNVSRYVITFVAIHYHPPKRILSFVGHGYQLSAFSMQLRDIY
jgi:hypothetical protein